MKRMLKNLFKRKNVYERKRIHSFIEVGDVIEIEELGENKICKVEDFQVIPNSPQCRPIDCVIHVKLSQDHGTYVSSSEYTSNNFKYIRHISHNKDKENEKAIFRKIFKKSS
jgi:hypothetical protein